MRKKENEMVKNKKSVKGEFEIISSLIKDKERGLNDKREEISEIKTEQIENSSQDVLISEDTNINQELNILIN